MKRPWKKLYFKNPYQWTAASLSAVIVVSAALEIGDQRDYDIVHVPHRTYEAIEDPTSGSLFEFSTASVGRLRPLVGDDGIACVRGRR